MKAIAAGVFRSAAQIIENQGNTPVSPCEVDPDGSVRLCAAAALAVAGVRLYAGQKSVGLLLEKLVAQPDRNLIRATFARFRWSTEDCDMKMQLNDSLSPAIRRTRIVSLFNNLASAM